MKALMRIFFILAAFVSSSHQGIAQDVATTELFSTPFQNTVTRTGKLDFKRTLTLSFKNQGYLNQLKVDEGQYFKKGDLLASLEIAELQQNRNAAFAELIKAKSAHKRAKRLFKENLASDDQVESASTLEETSRARFRIAEYNLNKSTVIAPFDGVVLSRSTELGELQNPGSPVLTVAAIENNWVVKVALTEREVATLAVGSEVDIKLNSLGMVKGVVSKIPAKADTLSNLFNIEVLLPDIKVQPGLIAGQIAEVTIVLSADSQVFRVPVRAIMSVDQQGQAIFIVKNQYTDAFEAQAYPVHKLDEQYVYVTATADQRLDLVTDGWQHLRTKIK